MDKIFIRGLKVRCIVGILPREREEHLPHAHADGANA